MFGKGEKEGGVPLGLNCFPQEVAGGDHDNDAMVEGTICSTDHSSPGLSFQITTTLYRAGGSLEDYGFKVHEYESEEEGADGDGDGDVAAIDDGGIDKDSATDDNNTDTVTDSEDDPIEDVPVCIRISITVTSRTSQSPSYSLHTLVELIPAR